MPISQSTDIILNSPFHQAKVKQEQDQETLAAAKRQLIAEPTRHGETGLAALASLTRRRRAERILAQQDSSVRAGPDEIKRQLETIRATRDPSGQTSPGLSEVEKTKRFESLVGDDRMLDFYELNPDAAAYSADDTSYASMAWQIVRDFPKETGEAAVATFEGIQQGRLQKLYGNLEFQIMQARATGFGEENLPKMLAERESLKRQLQLFPEREGFDKYWSSAGQFGGQIFEDFKSAGKNTAEMEVAVASYGAIAGSPGGPLAAAGSAGAAVAATAPFIFTMNLAREIWKTEQGSMYGELESLGYDPNDPATMAGAIIYGGLSTGVEIGSFKLLGKLFSPVAEASKVMVRSALKQHARSYLADTSRRRLAGEALKRLTIASAGEGAEEYIQSGFLSALGEAIAKGGTLTEVLDNTISGTIERNPEALEAGKLAAGGMFLGAGLGRLGSTVFIEKAARDAKREKAFFEAYEELTGTNKMIERDRRLAGEFLDFTLNQSEDRSTIYAEIGPMLKALEKQNLSLEELEAHLPGISERVAKAQETGGRVEISAKEFASQIAGTPFFKDIKDHITSTPTGLTNAERLAEFSEDTQTDIAIQRDRAARRLEIEDSADRVTEQIIQQLQATDSVFAAPREARRQAEVVRARLMGFADTLSRGAGRIVTPEEAFQLAPLTILSAEQNQAIDRGENVQLDDAAILNSAERRQVKLTPALRLPNGQVITGRTHGEALIDAGDRGDLAFSDRDDFEGDSFVAFTPDGERVLIGPQDQGFVTDEGDFLTRDESQDLFRVRDAFGLAEDGSVLNQIDEARTPLDRTNPFPIRPGAADRVRLKLARRERLVARMADGVDVDEALAGVRANSTKQRTVLESLRQGDVEISDLPGHLPAFRALAKKGVIDLESEPFDYRTGPGNPTNPRRTIKLKDGTQISIGPITPEDWFRRVDSMNLSDEQIRAFRNWYNEVYSTFFEIFGETAPIFAAAWLMAQQNAAPGIALHNALLNREQVINGLQDVLNRKRGGLADDRLIPFWQEVLEKGLEGLEVEAGSQKLNDFVDAALGRVTRTWMGNDPAAGEPAVADVHTIRDGGFVDDTFLDRLKKLAEDPSQLDGIEIDMKGAPSESQYEATADFLHDVRDYLNENDLLGGNFERVSEVQALGWMALLIQTGQAAQTVDDAIRENGYQISAELKPGEGAPFEQDFPEFKGLPMQDQISITHSAIGSALSQVMDVVGDPPLISHESGVSSWVKDVSASSQIRFLATPETAFDLANALGYLLQQTEVWSGNEMALTPSGDLPSKATHWFIDLYAPELEDHANQLALWDKVLEGTGMDLGFSPTTRADGTPALRIYLALRDPDTGLRQDWGRSNPKKAIANLERLVIQPIAEAITDFDFDVSADYAPGRVQQARNDWRQDSNGEAYLERFKDRPETTRRLRAARSTVESIVREGVARSKGLTVLNQTRSREEAGDGRFRLLDDAGRELEIDELYRGTRNTEQAQRSVYRALGLEARPGEDTNASLKIYPLQSEEGVGFGNTLEEVQAQLDEWLGRIGWSYRLFGPRASPEGKAIFPDFQDPATPSYDQNTVWIFDPREDEGSFRDHAYTLAWRVTHEMAHAIVNDRLTERYGGRGRRAGAMGRVIRGPYHKNDTALTLADALRAVDWEYETFLEQRRILEEEFGITITDEQFNQENSINLADAAYRAITGQFGSPGDIGIVPSNIDAAQLRDDALNLIRQIAREEGISPIERLDEFSQSLNQVAYHGTPHRFNEFDITKIGTGEGVQAFGWGLYFSSSRGIAEFYRKKLSGAGELLTFNRVELNTGFSLETDTLLKALIIGELNRSVVFEGGTTRAEITEAVQDALDVLIEETEAHVEAIENGVIPGDVAREESTLNALREVVASRVEVELPKPGQLFEVDIPEDNELMDWDAPFEDQSEAVKAAFQSLEAQENLRGFTRVNKILQQSTNPSAREQANPRGKVLYERLSRLLGSPKAASDALAAAGIKGHKYKAGQIAGNTNTDAKNYVIYDDQAIKVAQTFFALGDNGPRAQIAFRDNAAFIRVTQASELVDFQHELSHWFLHQMVMAESLGLASPQMQDDLRVVREWTGAATNADLLMPFADGRFIPGTKEVDKPHEIFARGFEAYMATGKAPTPELRSIFGRFRTWVGKVYGGIRGALQRVGQDLSPEIREVYDRLFDAEAAYDEASGSFSSPLFTNPADVGLAEDSPAWQRYLKKAERAREAALEKLVKSRVVDIAKRKIQEAREERARIKAEVESERETDPTWNAIRWLKRDIEPAELPGAPEAGTGLSPSAIREIYGDEADRVIELLNDPGLYGRGRKLVNPPSANAAEFFEIYDSIPDGIDPEDIADSFGFTSGRGLVDSILAARTVQQEINARVNAEIAQSGYYSDEATLEEAHAVVANEDREELLILELRFMRELLRGETDARVRQQTAGETTPSAEEADQGVADAAAELLEATRSDDESLIQTAQGAVVEAESRQRVAREGRRADRAAGRRAGALELEVDSGRIQERARQLVGDLPVGRLSRERRSWNTIAAKEGRKARRALAERRYAEAIQHLEKQLLAHFASEHVTKIESEVRKGQEYGAKFRKAKELEKLRAPGFDGTAVVLGLMDRFDFRKTRKSDPEKQPTKMERKLRSAIEKAQRQEAFESLLEFKEKADAAGRRFDFATFLGRPDKEVRHWTELSVDEFLGLIDTIRNVEAVTIQKAEDIRTGRAVEIADAANQVAERIRLLPTGKKTDRMLHARGVGRDTIRALLRSSDAALLKIEDLLDFMGGDDINNPVRVFLWEPIQQGTERLRRLIHVWADELDREIKSLDWNRLGKKVRIEGLNRDLYGYEILMMGLNWGNESNKFKLIQGYERHRHFGWTESDFERALMWLKPEEWETIQNIWNLFSEKKVEVEGREVSLREFLFEHEFQQTGRRVAPVEARAFTAPTGQKLAGGYFPIVYDPTLSDKTKKLMQDAEAKGLFGYSHMKTETAQGQFQSRAEGFVAPILLDPQVISSHLERVLHDASMRQAIVQTHAILNSRQVKQAMEDVWGNEYHEAINDWLKKVARVHERTLEGGLAAAASVSRWARQGTTMVGLGFRMFTGLLQLTGIFPVFGEVGWAATSLANAKFAANPHRFITEALEKSGELRSRARTRDRDLMEALDSLKGKPRTAQFAQQHAFIFITLGDRVVSAIAFQAQYNKSMSEHGDEARAIREADRAIRRTQGGGDVKDNSLLKNTDNELLRWATLFGSFASNLYARQRRMARVARGTQSLGDVDGVPLQKRNLPHAISLWASTILAPAVIESLVREGGPPEDEDELGLAAWLTGRVMAFHAMPAPFIGQELNGLFNSDQRFFAGRSPAGRFFKPVYGVADAGANFVMGEDVDEARLLKSTIELVGLGLHLPIGQATLWLDNFWDGQRLVAPQSPMDFVQRRRED